MRAVKLITWNPQDEVYEMSLGTLTATHISSTGYVEFTDAYIDRYELGTGSVGGDMTVDANIIPETTSSWLGDSEHPWGNVSTQGIRNTWVEDGEEHTGNITVYAKRLMPDPNAEVSVGLGDSDHPWSDAYIDTLQVGSIGGSLADIYGIKLYKSLRPEGRKIRLGDTGYYFSGVYTNHIDFGTGYIGTLGVGSTLSMLGSLRPTDDASYDLGSSEYKYRCVYTDNIVCTSNISCDYLTCNRIKVTGTIFPEGDSGRLGTSENYFQDVFTERVHFCTNGYISTAGVPGLMAMKGSLVPEGDATYDLGASSFKWRYIYTDNLVCDGITSSGNITVDNGSKFVGNLDGVIPYVEASNFNETVPIGCIVFLRVEYHSVISGTLNVGAKLTSGSSQYNLFIGCFSATGLYKTDSSSSLAEGQVFRTLSRGYCENKVAHVLAIRVDET